MEENSIGPEIGPDKETNRDKFINESINELEIQIQQYQEQLEQTDDPELKDMIQSYINRLNSDLEYLKSQRKETINTQSADIKTKSNQNSIREGRSKEHSVIVDEIETKAKNIAQDIESTLELVKKQFDDIKDIEACKEEFFNLFRIRYEIGKDGKEHQVGGTHPFWLILGTPGTLWNTDPDYSKYPEFQKAVKKAEEFTTTFLDKLGLKSISADPNSNFKAVFFEILGQKYTEDQDLRDHPAGTVKPAIINQDGRVVIRGTAFIYREKYNPKK